MKRRTFLATAAASLATPAVSQPARVLRFIPQADLSTIDPHWNTAYVTRNHGFMVFDTLYGMDSAYRATPQMLAGHTTESDGLRCVCFRVVNQVFVEKNRSAFEAAHRRVGISVRLVGACASV